VATRQWFAAVEGQDSPEWKIVEVVDYSMEEESEFSWQAD
jgi:hypothetical protein